MNLNNVVNIILFSSIAFILTFLLILIISQWLPQRKIGRLRLNALPVLRIQPIWYLFLKFILPRNQDFHRVVKMSQWNQGVDLIFAKERIFAAVSANRIFVHIFKPEYLEAVLTSSTIINKPWMYNMIKPLVGEGLLTSAGEKWKVRRKLLTPAFHFKILERFLPIINSHSFILIRKLKENSSYLDTVPMISLCTLDIIGETAMGVKINSQENEESEYVKAIIKLEELLTERTMFPWYWIDFLYYLTAKGKECRRVLNTVHNFTRQVVSEKKREMKKQLEEENENSSEENESENIYMKSKQRRAFLDLLLHQHFIDGSISEEDICEEVDTFMFEGHDTTAMGVSWALYNLGLYPGIQEKAYQEILDIFGNDNERSITADDIRKMKYLECVIKEALRLYPPVPIIARNNPVNINIHGKKIPANSLFNISIIGVHHDPEIYPNPEVFDPERFLPENSTGRHPFAYVPFSAGPRNCIGQKFAMMEEKILISNVLRRFNIKSLHSRDKIVSCGELVLRPINGLYLKFTERLRLQKKL